MRLVSIYPALGLTLPHSPPTRPLFIVTLSSLPPYALLPTLPSHLSPLNTLPQLACLPSLVSLPRAGAFTTPKIKSLNKAFV